MELFLFQECRSAVRASVVSQSCRPSFSCIVKVLKTNRVLNSCVIVCACVFVYIFFAR